MRSEWVVVGLVAMIALVGIVLVVNGGAFFSFSAANLAGDASKSVCKDSDGGLKPLVKGTVTAGGKKYIDVCSGTKKVKEYYCNAGKKAYKVLSCPDGRSCKKGACAATMCTDECAVGAKRCTGNSVETCGNYDGDSCREWGGSSSCLTEELCVDGVCTNRGLVYEPIVFALNQGYADKTPDWRVRADNAVDAINAVFAKTTNKRYSIERYVTYDDYSYETTWYGPEYHLAWGDVGATSIILLITRAGITVDELRNYSPSLTFNVEMEVNIDDIAYRNVLLHNSERNNLLLIEDNPENINGLDVALHELGHSNGLSVPDWYFFKYADCTATNPLLPSYDLTLLYPKDPMAMATSDFEFSQLNSEIIDKNLYHRYTFHDVAGWHAKNAEVYVTDSVGRPIEHATVRVFCVRKGCFYCSSVCDGIYGSVNSSTPLEVVYTDAKGHAEYAGPSGGWDMSENINSECIAKALKVEYQEKTGAAYVNFVDLQRDFILYNLTTHTTHIVLH